MTLRKPPHGGPCNSCGLCCKAEVCPLGQHVLKTAIAPCPALEPADGGRYLCGLIVNPARYSPARAAVHGAAALSAAAAHLNGAGTGCDAHIDGEPYDHAYTKQLDRGRLRHQGETKRAKRLWGKEDRF